VCPSNWKGTIQRPRCPEPNQPRVVPPLYDLAGIGVTAIVPQPIPGATDLHMIIADGKDNPIPGVGQLQSSGRKYSCDEFPPASWIEGGVGIAGSGNNLPGTQYCAPWAFKCDDETDARGSEQNWQGFIHGFLGAHLEARVAEDDPNYIPLDNLDNPIAFRFHYEDFPDANWAARVVKDGDQGFTLIRPGTPFTRRANRNGSRSVISFIPNGNGSLAIELENGEVFRTHERGSERRALKRVKQLARRAVDQNEPDVSNKTESPEWYVLPTFPSAVFIGLLTNIPL